MKFLSDVVVVAGLSLAGQFESTLPQSSGMSPFSVINSILNVDLNADLLDGQHGSYYLARTNHTGFQAISTISGLQSALDQWGGNIPDGSDLNTYVTSNKYGIPTHAGAATLLNAPTNIAGMLEVYKSGSFVYQTYKGLGSAKMYYRSSISTSSISSAWNTIATEDFVTSRGYTIVTGITNGNIPRWAGTSFGDSLLSQYGSAINVNGWLQIGTGTDYKQMFLGQNTSGALYFQGVSGFSDNMYWLSYDGSGIGFSVGGVLNNAFLISRSNGAASFAVSPSGPTPTTGLHLTNKTYVDGLISGKENSFSKGDIIAGAGISVSGTYTGRLVGAGNLTINATLVDRFLSPTAEASHLDLITQGGVKAWTITAANRPENYGTAFTFVGLSATGNGAATGTLINQILAGASGELYWRQSILDWSSWTPTYQIWTSKHFTAANVANGQAAYAALSGKENAFSKGNIVAGTGVSLTGSGVGRLYGAGDVMINVTSAAPGSWNDALTVNATAQIMPIISRGPATSPTDYLQFRPTDYGTGKPYLALAKSFTANKWEWYSYDGVSTTGNLNFALNLTRFDVALVDENRSISAGTGLLGGGTLATNRSIAFDTTWGDARYATPTFVTSQGYITSSSSNNLTNKTGNISMWTNNAGYVNTDTLVTTLGNFVRRDTPSTITASHIFTGVDLTMPSIHYHGLFSTTNTAFVNYYPLGGNGASNSFVNLRVWDAVGGTAKALALGGDGSLTWNGGNIALQSWVTSYGFLTSGAIAGYATESWVNSRGYITNVIASLGYAPMSNDRYMSINGGPFLYFRDNIVLTGLATSSDLSNYLPVNKTITFNGITYNLNSNPNLGSGGGGISGSGSSPYLTFWDSNSNLSYTDIRYESGRYSFGMHSSSLHKVTITGGLNVNDGISVSPENAAVLQLNSTSKGFLPPRMTFAQLTGNILSPALGLIAYVTGSNEGLYVYKSTGWTKII